MRARARREEAGMTSKERVQMAINHEEPDKVPLDSWMAPEVADELVRILNVDTTRDPFALGKRLGNDFFYRAVGFCEGFSTIYDESRKIAENLYQDNFGIKWSFKKQAFGGYCEMVEHPLADISAYSKFKWPDPLVVSKVGLEENRQLIARDGKQYGIIGAVACSMLEGAWYLRGLDNFLMDLAADLDFVNDLLDHTMSHSLALSRELVKMGVDILWWGDDFSVESGPIMRPELFRQLLVPRYAKAFNELRKMDKNVKIAFHCDGKVEWALDDLVEAGVDIINPLQPDVNDVAAVKRKYGKKLSVWGNVDTRRIMSRGTPLEVVEEVKNVIRTLSPGGGHLLSSNHTIQATPRAVENTIAFYWAAHSFRSYPIRLQAVSEAKRATRVV
jgi:uroporphyrinogen decarboxylase